MTQLSALPMLSDTDRLRELIADLADQLPSPERTPRIWEILTEGERHNIVDLRRRAHKATVQEWTPRTPAWRSA